MMHSICEDFLKRSRLGLL